MGEVGARARGRELELEGPAVRASCCWTQSDSEPPIKACIPDLCLRAPGAGAGPAARPGGKPRDRMIRVARTFAGFITQSRWAVEMSEAQGNRNIRRLQLIHCGSYLLVKSNLHDSCACTFDGCRYLSLI